MTREEHIQKAEELLAGTWERDVYVGHPAHHREPTAYAVALAQVHATLALTAPAASAEPVSVEEPYRPWWRRVVTR